MLLKGLHVCIQYQDVSSDLQQRWNTQIFFFHLWPEKLSQSSLPSPDLEDKNLPLLPPPGEKAAACPQRAFSTGGNWILVFLCPPAAPLCSLCWRCHHQRSNKAKATSAFSESLFTEMTSHSAPNTLGYSLTRQVVSALSKLDRSLKAQVIGNEKRNWKRFSRDVFSTFHHIFFDCSQKVFVWRYFFTGWTQNRCSKDTTSAHGANSLPTELQKFPTFMK